jgi:predicted GNAT family N-acyltransferase
MTVREAQPDERDAALELRRVVFVQEQGVPEELEFDAEDGHAVHLVAVEAGEVVGTCRLLPGRRGRLRLGRLAVAPFARGRGTASALLQDAAGRAIAGGFDTIVLHAQVAALGLYERAGYVPVGERFDEAGIAHQTMELRVV